ncbi:hypothetical protein RRG08_058933 [Elysia crispata]|uniref:Uncharacterized protein n=1 Tax=Elysia crispata TaxID=231223 RepID=A0AAE1CL45_9GAST|nr:hypothetical protein RRG08_058933 [Elysia crispata]
MYGPLVECTDPWNVDVTAGLQHPRRSDGEQAPAALPGIVPSPLVFLRPSSPLDCAVRRQSLHASALTHPFPGLLVLSEFSWFWIVSAPFYDGLSRFFLVKVTTPPNYGRVNSNTRATRFSDGPAQTWAVKWYSLTLILPPANTVHTFWLPFKHPHTNTNIPTILPRKLARILLAGRAPRRLCQANIWAPPNSLYP